MNIWWLVVILSSLTAAGVGFIWIVVYLGRVSGGKKSLSGVYTELAEEETSHLFNKEFREELRNRGRLRFQSIIEENAMFLKQDLDITTSQLNEYMKQQISDKLDNEFEAYAASLKDLQELAEQSLKQAAGEVEKERQAFSEELEKEVENRKQAMLKRYEESMAEVIEHYVLQALGEKFDFKEQLPYIIEQMEANKQDIIEDMKL